MEVELGRMPKDTKLVKIFLTELLKEPVKVAVNVEHIMVKSKDNMS